MLQVPFTMRNGMKWFYTKYRTEHYTEWERRYHPEEWAYTDNTSKWEHSISKSMFNYINVPNIYTF